MEGTLVGCVPPPPKCEVGAAIALDEKRCRVVGLFVLGTWAATGHQGAPSGASSAQELTAVFLIPAKLDYSLDCRL